MGRRRAGSVDMTKEGRWRVRVTLGDKRVSAGMFDTADEAHAALAKMRSNIGAKVRRNGSGVYFMRVGEGPIKIGYADNMQQRLTGLQCAHWEEVRVVALWRGATRADEIALHHVFKAARIRGEWFWPVRALLEEIARVSLRDDMLVRRHDAHVRVTP